MEELLLKLKANKINIKVVDHNLRVSVPEGFNDSNFIDELKENKESLIKYINEKRNLNKAMTIIPKAIQKKSYQLTPPQLRLFLLNQFNNDSLAYNLPGVFWIDGTLNYNSLNNAFKTLIARHESLRTSFSINKNDEPVQGISKEFSFEVERLVGNESEINTIISDFIKPFNLNKVPLLRASLVDISKEKHLFLIDMHHIISDGTSTEILIKELLLLYNGQELPPLEIQYKDFSEWYLSKDYQATVLEKKEFWAKKFSERKSPIELPTDFPRPKEKAFKGGCIKFSITKKKAQQLHQISQKNNTTLFTVLLGIYSILLSKLSNKQDIVIGTPVAGRNHTDLQGVIGMFINTLVLPLHLPYNFSFTTYLNELHQKVFAYFDNAEYPYERLINDLQVERDPSRNPLFDVLFVFQNMKKESFEMETINIHEYKLETTASKFDLVLEASEESSSINFSFEYSTELFTPSTIEKYINFFKIIMNQIVENEEVLLSDLSLLSNKEEQVFMNFNKVNFPETATLVSLFEEQVLKTPNKEAVVYNDTSLTYFELNNLANILAKKLRDKGVGSDRVIGLLMDKNLHTVVCLLGILKSGGCYLPIDPSYPKERINYMIKDSSLDILVTNKEFNNLITTSIDKVILEDVIGASLGKEEEPNLNHVNSPEDICYIIYTSGTTGNPKGVMVEHKNVVRLLFNEKFQFNFGKDDVWTMFHSHCFDVSVWEMYGALLNGGKLIVVSQSDARDPLKYLEILKENKVTILNQTPTAFYSLKNACEKENIILSNLRYVVFAGEALTPLKLKEWYKNHPKVKLINMYGITEVTVHTTYKEIGKEEIENNVSNIGKPIPTTSLYLLDRDKNLQPQGVTGEIYIGGEGVTRGYLNKTELTASRFIKNPYQEKERLYRSGDLGRLLKNGEVEYLGRIDKQVQLKGFRIELKEIEYHLLQHELITESVVIKKDSEKNQPYLCAYYISKNDAEVNNLRTYLGEYLPSYMIPSYFVKLNEIPFTSNNKVAVSKLPEPETGSLINNYIAPTNKEELIMSKVWEEELGLEQVGIRDNFFSLGGDSLKAIGLISTINKKLVTSLTIADLYSYQTIEELLVVKASKRGEEDSKTLEEAKKEVRLFQEAYKKENEFLDTYEEVYPMNGVEKGMIFYSLQRKSDNLHDIFYHEQNMYDFPYKHFDFELFKKAMGLMAEKHGELRKIFNLDNLAHIIKKEIDPEINFIDICYLNKEEQEVFIKQKMHAEKLKRTDLSFSLIWRMNIIKIRDDYQYILFDFNHTLFDGWSLSSFLTELQKVYLAISNDKNYVPEKLQSSYENQIIGELAAVNNKASIKYWKEELEGYTRFELQPTGMDHEFLSDEFKFGKDYRKKLETVAKKYNTSFKHLCFSAYIYTLRMLSYGNDITIGMVTNIRPLVHDAEQLLGCFLNTIPFRTQIPEGLTWGEYIVYIENKLRELKYHERVPFYKILEIVKEVRSGNNPIFDVSFNYIDFRIFNELQASDETIKKEETTLSKDYLNENTLLSAHVFAHENDFNLALTYSTSFFTKTQIKRISNYFKNILDQFLYNAEVVMEKQLVLTKGNDSIKVAEEYSSIHVNYGKGLTVLDLFEKQVQLNPDKTAVVFEEKKLTYKELDTVSNQLSNVLIAKGVTLETLVPICVERSLDMIIGILGILKSGGAYVPIDPNYPKKRIDYILKDIKAAILLLQSQHEGYFNIPSLCLDNQNLYKDVGISKPDIFIPETSLAYVIYTSGTTGQPKGVMNAHAGIFNRLSWMKNYLEVLDSDAVLQKTNYCFDVSIWELLYPLIVGAKLIFSKPEGNKDVDYLQDLIYKERITTMHFVPSMLSVFLPYVNKEKCNSLKNVICSGEELKLSTVKDFKSKLPNVKLYNFYGPTEAAIEVTAINLTNHKNEKVTIGSPISNIQIYIVDSQNNIQPTGSIGELLIGGVQVARGYLNQPELTAQKFIKNPFNEKDNYKLFKTGDLGRWLPNGTIEFLGRNDNQVKIRGFRIELGEIISKLEQYVSIIQALVLVKESGTNKYLIGYYVSNEVLVKEDIITYLSDSLPDYMIPKTYVLLKQFPLMSNGKIDYKALPIPDYASEEKYIAPETIEEHQMVNIWSEVLGLNTSKIGLNDNFFNLGGHSLSAIKLKHEINKEFKVELPLVEIFLTPALSSLSNKIKEWEAKKEDNRIIVPLNSKDREETLFMIHDGSGEIDGYLELTRRITQYKCYGIKYGHYNGIDKAPTITEMASMYIKEIKAIQNTGPYHLLGWSLGGVIATEMTLQLEKAGERIENLIVVDPLFQFKKPAEKIEFTIESEIELIKSKFGVSDLDQKDFNSINEVWIQFLKSEVFKKKSLDEMRSVIPQKISQLIPDFLNKNSQEIVEATNKIRVLIAASDNYLMNSIVQATTLYLCPTQSESNHDIDKLKHSFTNLTIQDIRGDHFSVMKSPLVTELSDVVNNQLELKLVGKLQT